MSKMYVMICLAIAITAVGVAKADLPVAKPPVVFPPDEPSFMLDQILVEFNEGVSLAEAQSLGKSIGATTHKVGRNLPFNVIVFPMPYSPEEGKAAYEAGDIEACRGMYDEARAYVYDVIEAYERSGLVKWARPNYIIYANLTPNDPYYRWPTGWPNDSQPDQYGVIQMNPETGWNTTTGEDVVIVVTDSGLDLDHPDIAANVWTNPGETPGNSIDDDGNGYVDDVHGYDFCGAWNGDPWSGSPNEDSNPDVFAGDPACGDGEDNNLDGVADLGVGHGTMTSGCAACVINNSNGYAGVAGNANVAMARCLSPEGGGTEAMIAAAFEYARAVPADVISTSLGGTVTMPLIQSQMQQAYSEGIPMFCASGNDGTNNPTYPAYYSECLAVGGVKHDDSGRTTITTYGNWLDCCAASGDIVGSSFTEIVWSIYVASVADANGDPGLDPGDPMLAGGAGTSLAAPYVAGVGALIRSVAPAFTVAEVYSQITDHCYDVPPAGYDIETGYGRVDISASLEDWDDSGVRGDPAVSNQRVVCFPNPSREGFEIAYAGSHAEHACHLEIFDVEGNLVGKTRLCNGHAHWDGTDGSGADVGSGIFFYRVTFETGERSEAHKLVRIR